MYSFQNIHEIISNTVDANEILKLLYKFSKLIILIIISSCNKANLLLAAIYVLSCCGAAVLFKKSFAFCKQLIENKKQVFRHNDNSMKNLLLYQ